MNPSQPRPIRILMVDTDEDDSIFVQSLLAASAAGRYELDWAPNCAAARDAMKKQAYQVYLFGQQLGRESGHYCPVKCQAPRRIASIGAG